LTVESIGGWNALAVALKLDVERFFAVAVTEMVGSGS